MKFEIEFHGPFRVAVGAASPGVDISVDEDELLPESSLKGVMRAAATEIGMADHLIAAVFGTASSGSPWSWLPDDLADGDVGHRRARAAIAPATGTVAEGALLMAQEAWAPSARFEVVQRLHIPTDKVDQHRAVLAVAARGVRSLGATRNRGLGWVTITPLDVPAELMQPSHLRDLLEAT